MVIILKKRYYKENLQVIIGNYDKSEEKNANLKVCYPDNFYILFCVLTGKMQISCSKWVKKITEKQIFIGDINTPFSYNFIKNTQCEFVCIKIHPDVLHSIKSENEDFLRIFKDKNFSENIIDINNDDFKFFFDNILSVVNCVNLNYGKIHILSRICSALSELCMYYDKNYNTEFNSTDSIAVKIIEYIRRHYTEKITYDILTKKFAVSKDAVNTIMKLYTGRTLNQYVNHLRLKSARIKLYGGNMDYAKIAELCGYNNYSTFYRAYIREFGISPSEEYNKERQENYPYT